jgi:hypothetical protein
MPEGIAGHNGCTATGPMRTIVVFAVLTSACGSRASLRPDSNHSDGAVVDAPTGSLDARADLPVASCTSLDECACLRATGCAPIGAPCWCPYPACDPSLSCVCGGGRFIGCAPAGSNCPAPTTCGLLAEISAPDPKGCRTCIPPTDCQTAVARLGVACPLVTSTALNSFCASYPRPDCATECLGQITGCNDVACSSCDTCDCAGDRFSTCYSACANRG